MENVIFALIFATLALAGSALFLLCVGIFLSVWKG